MDKTLFIIIIFFILSSCNKEKKVEQELSNSSTSDCNKNYFNPEVNYSTITDIEGNIYKTVQINNQIWMAENLKTTKFSNGDSIKKISSSDMWISYSQSAWCHLSFDEKNDCHLGKLYNFYSIQDNRNVCPTGWHVPTNNDWYILCQALGGFGYAGSKMKVPSTYFWQENNTASNNQSGFTALPCPRFVDGVFDSSEFKTKAYWWTSSTDSSNFVYSYSIFIESQYELALIGQGGNKSGIAVRCIKD